MGGISRGEWDAAQGGPFGGIGHAKAGMKNSAVVECTQGDRPDKTGRRYRLPAVLSATGPY